MAVSVVQDGVQGGGTSGGTALVNSGTSSQVLNSNTTPGHAVALFIRTNGTSAPDVSSVVTSIGTFTRINDVLNVRVMEWWYCANVTGAADTITVTTTSGAQWSCYAVELSGASTGADGGSSGSGLTNPTLNISGGNGYLALAACGNQNKTGNPSSPWVCPNYGTSPNGVEPQGSWSIAYATMTSSSITNSGWLGTGLDILAMTVKPSASNTGNMLAVLGA